MVRLLRRQRLAYERQAANVSMALSATSWLCSRIRSLICNCRSTLVCRWMPFCRATVSNCRRTPLCPVAISVSSTFPRVLLSPRSARNSRRTRRCRTGTAAARSGRLCWNCATEQCRGLIFSRPEIVICQRAKDSYRSWAFYSSLLSRCYCYILAKF